MFFHRFLPVLAAVASLVAGQTPPSRDPWYSAPQGFEDKAPGTVLRVRPALGNLTSVIANSSAAYNLLYRTTDSNGKATWAVTTVFTPTHRDNTSALLNYMIPYNTPYLDASPSYALYSDDSPYQSEISTFLGRGWFVNVPDFEGPDAALICVVGEAQATIDSVRALFSLHDSYKTAQWAPQKVSTRVALYGFSGGSLATEFVTELLPSYAPELSQTVVGAAINSIPQNITATDLAVGMGGQLFAGLVPATLVGLGRKHGKFNATLYSTLKDSGAYNSTTFLSVETMDFGSIINKFANQNIANYFVTDSLDIFKSPEYVEAVNRDAIAGLRCTPRVPLWIFKSVDDEVAPIAETDTLYKHYCGDGARIYYMRNNFQHSGHLDSQTNGFAPALDWLAKALSGTLSQTSCSMRNVSIGPSSTGL